jgi:hypothetical protein
MSDGETAMLTKGATTLTTKGYPVDDEGYSVGVEGDCVGDQETCTVALSIGEKWFWDWNNVVALASDTRDPNSSGTAREP